MKNIDNNIVAPANRVALILFGGESILYFAPRTIRLIDYTLCLKMKLGARFILILQKKCVTVLMMLPDWRAKRQRK